MKLRLGEFSVSGSGDLVFEDLDCKNLTSKVSGSGDITLKGKADEARYSVSGSGDARVYAKDNMNLSVSGSGDIRYKGPANVNKSKSGSGSIQGAN